jgi:hypothetical protein
VVGSMLCFEMMPFGSRDRTSRKISSRPMSGARGQQPRSKWCVIPVAVV